MSGGHSVVHHSSKQTCHGYVTCFLSKALYGNTFRLLFSCSVLRYFKIEREKNMCGLAACSSYPVPLV